MRACPRRNLLAAYEKGTLSEGDAELIERHLSSCPSCRSSLNRIRESDVFAKKLRTLIPIVPRDVPGTWEISGADPARPDETTVLTESRDEGRIVPTFAVDPTDFGSAHWAIPDYDRVVLCSEGSYGSVWAVRDRVGAFRALKVIDLDRLQRRGVECRERAALEAYCRKVPHDPHLITIYHVGFVENLLYYTMELADDHTTRRPVRDAFPASYRPLTLSLVLEGRRLGVDVSIEIARRLLQGLARLHDLGLVHRDIKPSNIVFVDHRPKLADIGIVTTEAETGQALGTPAYMPPDRVMDRTADTYALGKVLYEMLAGRGSPGFPIPPLDRRWEKSRWNRGRVSRVIARACSDATADRYQSAAAMLTDLEQCVELTMDSLFDELDEPPGEPPNPTVHEAIQLGYTLLRALPWIFGIIALLLIISLMTG